MKTLLCVLIYASVSTFRRAGHAFTDKGSAFPTEHFTDEQAKAISAEPRLSVKEVSIDAIPDGVDRSYLDKWLAAQPEETEKAPAAQKTESSTGKTESDKETRTATAVAPKKPAAKKPAAKAKAAPADNTAGETAATKQGE